MKHKPHRIKNPWVRIPLKTLGWTLATVLALLIIIPIAVYIPPVQTFMKNIACKVVKDKTGMDIGIKRFRIKFPLDVSLQEVHVVEAAGDTMVNAKEAIVDVKLLPLLHLDVQVKNLKLLDGYYRMVSADSSMIMKIRAGLLDVDAGSSADIAKSRILLDKALLKDGDVSLYMDVWKKKPSTDTTSTPFLIQARQLRVENIAFGMSMLPTIDTLRLTGGHLNLDNATINLATNDITADNLSLTDGSFRYITPTPQYIAAHPAPIDTISPPSAPMTIQAKKISLQRIDGLYAMKGAKPQRGFDANYVEVKNVGVVLSNFYNQASTLILPIDSLTATERCGLNITSGSGTFRLDSVGMALQNFKVRTPYSDISANANIPFALMALQPSAPVNAKASVSLGMPDLVAFMPTLKTYTSPLSGHGPLTLDLDANGTLSSVAIPRLNASMAGVFRIRANGYADNALDFKRLRAGIDIDGEVVDPRPIEKITGPLSVEIPAFHIKGKAGVDHSSYTADISLTTPKGKLAAKGGVNLNAETYNANINVHDIDVAHFVPSIGVGKVTLSLNARGAGFNPVKTGAATDVDLNAATIVYKGTPLHDIVLHAKLHDGDYVVSGSSPNTDLNFDIDLEGHLAEDDYSATGYVRLHQIDLQALGITPDVNSGTADFYIDAQAQPSRWLYRADLRVRDFDWCLPAQDIHIPAGLTADIDATESGVTCLVVSDEASIDFVSTENLKTLVDAFSATSREVTAQIGRRELMMDSIQKYLPKFNLNLNASGRGMLSELLQPSGISLDTVYATFSNDSLFHGNASLLSIADGSFKADTISLALSQRGNLLDYQAHLGNRPGTLDEFAQVNLNGYVGSNRLSAFLRQQNIAGETGYRLGLTAALRDSVVSVHFTPLKSTLAYLPWTMNSDNYIDMNLKNYEINANLYAQGETSSILVKTEPSEQGGNDLHLNLTNIHIQDFLQMSVFAPPLTATVSSDIKLHYGDNQLTGKGNLAVSDFTYNKMAVGNFDLDLNAGLDFKGDSQIDLGMKVDNQEKAMTLSTVLDQATFMPKDVKLNLNRFPLKIANAFLGDDVARLSGRLNGDIDMTGSITSPLLNGNISCDSVGVYVPMIGSTLRFSESPIAVANNVLRLSDFSVYGVNSNPLTIDGEVNASDLSDIGLNLTAQASNFQPIGNDKRARSDIYGKLFLNLDASARGSMKMLDVSANVNVLGSTDVYYIVSMDAQQNLTQTENNVVKFVNFSDSTLVSKADSVQHHMAMRVNANLTLSPGMEATVNLNNDGSNKVQLTPSGNLNFFMNYMGDMRLNGTLNVGEGMAKYSMPVIGLKQFDFNPQSSVQWNGEIMNPILNIKATDTMKTNVVQGGNSRLVNFIVTLSATGSLSHPNVMFDLSTDDDMTLQNELQSMSADQRQQQAMTLLITGRYSGQDIKTASSSVGNMALGNVYNYAADIINQWAAKTIKGVDLSFGVDQYDKTTNGQTSTATSYSYQLSKSLFNNRFKINVGGNYSTDASSDENLTENLISDISFEYILKQTTTLTMYARLFRHTGYESILEGEITETGVGFVMKRRLQNLRSLFRFGKRRRKAAALDTLNKADTIPTRGEAVTIKEVKEENHE